MNKAAVRELLRQSDFKGLFLNELGWDDHHGALQFIIDGAAVTLTAVAEKRGMAAYVCTFTDSAKMWNYQTRCKIEAQLAKQVHEHLIIYAAPDLDMQTWQWVKRQPGKPVARREHSFNVEKSGESLLQKLEPLVVTLDEEERLTLPDVTSRVAKAFDVDRVTKRFYDRFKTEHAAFLKQIKGINVPGDCEWYASIMFNRLKFIYFIQKKGFLDKDLDYLRNRLQRLRETHPQTKFLSFYRDFLLKLFHDGLGCEKRDPELRNLLGNIPYLNGGIFAVHHLEETYPDIDIPDEAFEKVFDFFDQYNWHLDERPLRNDNEINPDVLGYIFEKYINQKQMGAYYTKEDITEYIAKNCIIPFILDRVEADLKKKPEAFSGLFQALGTDPDRYIYEPVRHGVDKPLPPEIEEGIDTSKPNLLERRAAWNNPAPAEFALPTEIWREVVARHQRYAELCARLTAKPLSISTNDLITLNLNIRQFAQDCIENATTPDVLWGFWRAIEEITVLDPTCGSGAFLFAAVNVLEPLYEACLDRMKAFMLEWSQADKVPHPNYYKDFAEVIARVDKHPNEKYFIFKSIIIRNLFGVDIMDEAVEICKLRLFLKLAAQIEPDYAQDNLGIEPLPDIDFNIRAGNTLVGFATKKQAEDVILQDLLGYQTVWPEVQREAEEIAELFKLFRQQQTEIGGAVSAADKQRLRDKLTPLEARLNTYLASTYDITDQKGIKNWIRSHKPFHWFIEFYEIMQKGGFDAIIGNPPYVEYKDVRSSYQVRNYLTTDCSNLFAFIVERCTFLGSPDSRIGMIIPLSAFSTDRMTPLIQHFERSSRSLHISHFGWRPGKLFDGVNLQLSIMLQSLGSPCSSIHTTRYLLWDSEARPELFSKIEYVNVTDKTLPGSIPKLGTNTAASILNKLRNRTTWMGRCLGRHSDRIVYYRRGGLYWKVFVDFATKSSEEKLLFLDDGIDRYCIISALCSNLWWWYFTITSDCRHLGNRDIFTFPFDPREMVLTERENLSHLGKEFVRDLQKNAIKAVRVYKETNSVDCLSFRVSLSKPIIDEIDKVLAKHYGFTEEELDFIINYDIKYRMGRNGDKDEGED